MAVETHAQTSSTSPSRSRTSTCSRWIRRCGRRSRVRARSGRWSGCARRAVVAASAEAQAHCAARRAQRAPALTHDRFGHRVDQVELDPSGTGCSTARWRAGSIAAVGRSAPGRARRPRRAELVWTHANAGVMCPISMTYSAVPALRVDPEIAAEWEPRRCPPRRAVRDGDDREAGRLRRARQHHPRRAGRRRLVRAHRPQVVLLAIRRATSSSCSRRRAAGLSCFVLERGAGMEFQR